MDERSASSVQAGAFTISGENLTEGTDYSFSGTTETNGVLTILSSKNMTIQNTDSSTATKDRIEINSEANLTLAGVNIGTNTGAAIKIQDNATFDVNVLLADGSENILSTAATDCAGLQKNGDISTGTLTIQGDTAGTGKLTAIGGFTAAGIGGGNDGNGSNITISGCQVEAFSGYAAAAIGGGEDGDGENITISGAIVTATADNYGAGIGGGIGGSGKNIIITDSTVTATAGGYAAGIGGGDGGGGGENITITNSNVTATGGKGGAGIGGGENGNGNNIEISGGVVKAIGGSYEVRGEKYSAPGIGGGAPYSGQGGQASGNSISGNAIVFAVSGGEDTATGGIKEALQGFDEASGGSMTQGIAFTGVSDHTTNPPTIEWDSNGNIYGNEVTIKGDVTFPADLTIGDGQKLVIAEDATLTIPEDVTVTVDENATFENKGTVAIDGNATFENKGTFENEGTIDGEIEYSGSGKEVVLVTYDACGGTVFPASEEKTYKDASGIKTYETLPTPTKTGYTFDGWYTEQTGGTQVNEGTEVMSNAHTLYAHWQVVPTPSPSPTPVPTPSPTPGGGSDGGFSWNAGGNSGTSSSASENPKPSSDTSQIEMVETKTLKDIQSQLPDKVKVVGYIEGYDDGTFKPNNNMTRAEAVQMLYKLIYNGTKVNYETLKKFNDTNQTAWYSTALAYLTEQGLIDGDGGKFYPNRQITRAEMSKILYNALLKYDKNQDKKMTYGSAQFNFTDVSNNWMLEPIKYLATNGMIHGYGDGTFKPNNNITRAESVAMIAKVFDRSQTFSQRVSFKDVSQSHWAYKYIMNAVNGES